MLESDLARHRTMAAWPELWPCYPFLPVIRSRSDGGLDLGVLADMTFFGQPPSPHVYRANLLLLPFYWEELSKLPMEYFESLDALLAAGWRVD